MIFTEWVAAEKVNIANMNVAEKPDQQARFLLQSTSKTWEN